MRVFVERDAFQQQDRRILPGAPGDKFHQRAEIGQLALQFSLRLQRQIGMIDDWHTHSVERREDAINGSFFQPDQ